MSAAKLEHRSSIQSSLTAVAMRLPAAWGTAMNETKPKRRWYQFSLRFLLLATVLIAFLTNAAVRQIMHANQVRRAAAALSKLDAVVRYDYEIEDDPSTFGGFHIRVDRTPPAPQWIRDLIGDEYFVEISDVILTTETDGLKVVDDIPNVRFLSVERSDITDKDLVKLKPLSKLTAIWLDNTAISDEGLKHLESLKQLRRVMAPNTKITKTGAKELLKALPNVQICYGPEGEFLEGRAKKPTQSQDLWNSDAPPLHHPRLALANCGRGWFRNGVVGD